MTQGPANTVGGVAPHTHAPATFGETSLQHAAEHRREESDRSSLVVVSAAWPHQLL